MPAERELETKVNTGTVNTVDATSGATNGAQVTDGVYISDLQTAKNSAWILANHIDYIINLSGFTYDSSVRVLVVDCLDELVSVKNLPTYVEKFMKIAKLVTKLRAKNKRVLVHCYAGINRSATAIGFYMAMCGQNRDQVMNRLIAVNRSRGLNVLTNPSFMYMLECYMSYKKIDSPRHN